MASARATRKTKTTRIGLAVATAAAVLVAVVGTGGMAGGQVAPPVVTASATDGLLTESGNCSGPSTFSLDRATISVSRTGETTDALPVSLAWSGTIEATVFGAPETLTIPAGAATATFEIESGQESGTVTIEIGPAPDPAAPYDVGDPNTATATVLQVIADPVCATVPASSTTTTMVSTPPPDQPPAAKPVAADPAYTG